MVSHDFSEHSDACCECGLPITAWDKPCVPSTDDSAIACEEIKETTCKT